MAYNSMPAPSPAEALGLNAAGLVGPGLGIEGFDSELTFDDSMLDGVNGLMPTMPFTPGYDLESFTTTFEDPFSYARPYETAPNADDANDEGSSPQQPDDKLLGFSPVAVKATPLDDAIGTYTELNMSAELYGMFFVAEDVFGASETTGRPLELTCYRRNLWQCSGQITIPRHCTQVMNEQGRAIPIVEFYASISAAESIEGKPTEIISIPWKSSNTALGGEQETKVAGAPPKILLDPTAGQELPDGHRVSLPVSWKRLQFKSATANNGRRKGLQQHYVVQISLLGKMKTGGELMKIAEIQSGPVIVRGRSPRNFDSRKDVSLSSDTKKTANNGDRPRTQSDASTAPTPNLKSERIEPSQNQYPTPMSNNNSAPTPQWIAASTPAAGQNVHPHPAKRVAVSPNISKPPIPKWGQETSPNKMAKALSSAPINLSLSEDERSPNNRSTTDPNTSPRLRRMSSFHNAGTSPLEEGEELYEYFPLSLDDWTPLVETVYRPHLVHHVSLPQELEATRNRSKSKRYFSAD